MESPVTMVRDYWREQDFPPAAGATEAEMAAFEGKHGVRLPPDVRSYFAWANGMADHLDYEYAEFPVFHPLDQVRPLADSAPDNAERAWAEAGRPAKEIASYFWFADVCYTRLVYAVCLSGGPSAVVVLDQTDYDAPRLWAEAESFAAFLRAYAGGAETAQGRSTP